MNIEHPEYNRDTNQYPSFGKKYNGERGVISLTSWKARIDTVSKTLYSLLKQCPGFHIVLVLSEEEFPMMMDEMPASLKLFVKNDLIEVLWVYKNYKSFKKVLFTMDKYRDVPVISADDDCIYTCNYAERLYKKWLNHPDHVISLHGWSSGYGIIFYPIHNLDLHLERISKEIIDTNNDDMFYHFIFSKRFIENKIDGKDILVFSDTSKVLPITTSRRKSLYSKKSYKDRINGVFRDEYYK